MTKTAIRNFFENEQDLVKDDNNTYWQKDRGFVLFNNTLVIIQKSQGKCPYLLGMHSFSDISLLANHPQVGIIVGSEQMEREMMEKERA